MNRPVEKLAKDFFKDLMEELPHLATVMGIHQYDEEMPQGTPESVEALKKRRNRFIEELESVTDEQLGFEERIDLKALLNVMKLQKFEEEKHGRDYSHPTAGMIVSNALYSLFVKEFAPLEVRLDKISRRMEKIPSYLENTKKVLTDPVQLWVELGADEVKNMVGFINTILKVGKEEQIAQRILNRLNDNGSKCINALQDYSRWLIEDVLPKSREDFAMKPEDFDRLMEMRKLGMNTEELLEFGEEQLEIARENQKRIASIIAPGKSVEEAKKIVRQNHPDTFEKVLEKTIQSCNEARQFVIDNDFATLPENEELRVIETPSFARSFIPFGAYMPPGKFDKKQVGYYWMSRPLEKLGQKMEIHNFASILNTSVHEAYPGHHLQMVCENNNQAYSRLLTSSIEFVEGWAHYCEEKVAQLGFADDPMIMLERYNDMIWRATRIIVDIKLSRGEYSFMDAVRKIQQETGYDEASCIADVNRYTIMPGYNLSYLVGKHMLKEMLKRLEQELEGNFKLKKFHDTLLYTGSMPLHFTEKLVRHRFGLNDVSFQRS